MNHGGGRILGEDVDMDKEVIDLIIKLLLASFVTMTSTLISNIASNKYIVLFGKICLNNYTYNKIRLINNSII